MRYPSIFFDIILCTALGTAYADSSAQKRLTVEVFTVADPKVQRYSRGSTGKTDQDIDLHLYELNQIELAETKLSDNLPSDPKQSKHLTLERIQTLDAQAMTAIQNSAIGLSKAMQYGVDRYPAIVFERKAVIYGLTDLSAAINHYQVWRAEVQSQ